MGMDKYYVNISKSMLIAIVFHELQGLGQGY